MQNTTVYRTTYRKICTHCGNDILEKLTESEQYELDRRRRNKKQKEDRMVTVGAWIGSMVMVGTAFFFVAVYIIGGFLQ